MQSTQVLFLSLDRDKTASKLEEWRRLNKDIKALCIEQGQPCLRTT